MFLHIPGVSAINLDFVAEIGVQEESENKVSLMVYHAADYDPEREAYLPTYYPLHGYKNSADAEHALRLAFEGFFYKAEKLCRFPTPVEYYGTFEPEQTNREGS